MKNIEKYSLEILLFILYTGIIYTILSFFLLTNYEPNEN